MRSLKTEKHLVLARLLRWRRQKAEQNNNSLERVLPAKLIAPIVKGISGNKKSLLQNRRIPDHITRKHGDVFVSMFEKPPSPEESSLLERIPKQERTDGRDEDILVELLHLLIKHKAMEEGIAAGLMHSRNFLRELRENADLYDEYIKGNWREAFLGPNFCTWLANMSQLNLRVGEGEIKITLAE